MERPGANLEEAARGQLPFGLWSLGLSLLFAWQIWLTFGLFGGNVDRLLNDEPLIPGAYPQHIYLGVQGAQALVRGGRSCVYDPANLVGFLKTPIFDGSRMAEFCLLLSGGTYRPEAYKLGLAASCLLVPLLLVVAARGAGLGRATSLLATVIGQLLWWGPLGRGALEAGHSEFYLAALTGLAHVGLLVAFHRTGSIPAWLGLGITACLGWFLQPLLFPMALPLLLAFYLSVGARHDFLTWHVAFWLAEACGVLFNLVWLVDWLNYWWLRAPLPSGPSLLTHRSLAGVWESPFWGGPGDRLLAIVLIASGAVGVLILNQTQQRPTARLLGMGAGGALVLALLGLSWEPLGQVGTAALLAPALWFACLPAAHAWVWVTTTLWAGGWLRRGLAVGLVGGALGSLTLVPDAACCLGERCREPEALAIGLGPERQALVLTLVRETTADARILWEDMPLPRHASRWPALLPLLTGRPFLGGLDPDGFIEHSSICLTNSSLEGDAIGGWTDDRLEDYCRRYNIGWVVAWSPATAQRFRQWSAATPASTLRVDEAEGVLFRVRRDSRGFTLKGRAEFVHADSRDIVLADVTPENGVVVLSLHYQSGLRASPGRVQVEREASGEDLPGFVRLRLAAPAARVTLTWER